VGCVCGRDAGGVKSVAVRDGSGNDEMSGGLSAVSRLSAAMQAVKPAGQLTTQSQHHVEQHQQQHQSADGSSSSMTAARSLSLSLCPSVCLSVSVFVFVSVFAVSA